MKPLIELLQLLLSIFIKPKEGQVSQVPQVSVIEVVTAPEPVQEPIVTKPIPKPTIYTGWLKSAIKKNFPASQYMQEKTAKNQIILHHSVGGSAQSSINTWLQDPQRVCTHFIIERNGTAYQLFSLDYWGYHLYVASPGNKVDIEFKKNDGQSRLMSAVTKITIIVQFFVILICFLHAFFFILKQKKTTLMKN
jgi:hypothetical protein